MLPDFSPFSWPRTEAAEELAPWPLPEADACSTRIDPIFGPFESDITT